MHKAGVTVLIFFLLMVNTVSAQQKDSAASGLMLSGFVDAYYVYDFNKPSGNRQPYLFNHNRHNEIQINLGLIKAEVQARQYRAALALQAGTYAMDNYAAEPQLMQHVFEASAGFSPGSNGRLWLDAGIMPSYIGFESAISIDNWTLTRSLLAENSPYFITGLKGSYRLKEQLSLSLLLMNGWQRISRISGNSLPSAGTQLHYKKDDLEWNWSSFTGTDDPDSTRRMRYFNNFFARFRITETISMTTGFDIGLQQKQKASASFQSWYSPLMIIRTKLNRNWFAAFRAEYFADPSLVVINDPAAISFRGKGFSLNLDYHPAEQFAWRCEARWIQRAVGDHIDTETNRNQFFIATSIAVKMK